MPFDIDALEKQLMSKIDRKNMVEVEKVRRYIVLVELNKELDESIKKDGVSVVTINGSQKFIKSNPALADKTKVNTALLNIEKTFDFNVKQVDDYTAEDLI